MKRRFPFALEVQWADRKLSARGNKRIPALCLLPATEHREFSSCIGLYQEKSAAKLHSRYICVLNLQESHSQWHCVRCISWLTPALYHCQHQGQLGSCHALPLLGIWEISFQHWENHKSRNQWSHHIRQMLSWDGRKHVEMFPFVADLKENIIRSGYNKSCCHERTKLEIARKFEILGKLTWPTSTSNIWIK